MKSNKYTNIKDVVQMKRGGKTIFVPKQNIIFLKEDKGIPINRRLFWYDEKHNRYLELP